MMSCTVFQCKNEFVHSSQERKDMKNISETTEKASKWLWIKWGDSWCDVLVTSQGLIRPGWVAKVVLGVRTVPFRSSAVQGVWINLLTVYTKVLGPLCPTGRCCFCHTDRPVKSSPPAIFDCSLATPFNQRQSWNKSTGTLVCR